MTATISLPGHMMLHAFKGWQDILCCFRLLTRKVTANITQNSLSDNKDTDEVCVFDEQQSRNCRQVVKEGVGDKTEAGTICTYYVKTNV